MLSKEFLKEAPRINPATGDPYTAAERDAEYEKTKAQGQKNLQGIKDFGSKIGQGVKNFFKPAAPVTSMDDSDDFYAREFVPPAAAPAAPASNPEAELDPAIMRARYDQEAAARKAAPADAAPPPPGGEVRPVPSSTIQATPLAEPKSFSEPAAAAGAAPAPMKGGYGSGMNNPSVAPKTAAAATDDGPEQLGYSPDELERIQKNAGLATAQPAAVDTAPVPASANASSSYTGTPAATTATAAAVDTAPVPDSANASSSYTGTPAAPAATTAAAAAPAQTAEPAPVKSFTEPAAAAPAAAAPAAVGQTAASMAGAMRSTGQAAPKPAAKSNPAVLKQQQDLIAKGAKIKADGVMGPATQAAIKQFAAAPAASRSAAPAAGAGRGFVNPTAADTKAAVAAAKPATPAKPAAPVKPTVKESQEISRMRFLAGLIKDQK